MNKFMPDKYYKSVYDINLDLLKKEKIKNIFFDVDNTLLTYDEDIPSEKIVKYIDKLKKMGFTCFLFSNSNSTRIDKIKEILNVSSYTSSMKPLKKNYKKVLKEFDKKECIFIGDQIMTDVLGAKRMGFKVIFVDSINNTNEPLSTKFFRVFEKIVLKYLLKSNNFKKGKYYE